MNRTLIVAVIITAAAFARAQVYGNHELWDNGSYRYMIAWVENGKPKTEVVGKTFAAACELQTARPGSVVYEEVTRQSNFIYAINCVPMTPTCGVPPPSVTTREFKCRKTPIVKRIIPAQEVTEGGNWEEDRPEPTYNSGAFIIIGSSQSLNRFKGPPNESEDLLLRERKP